MSKWIMILFRSIWVQLLDRKQQKLELVLLSIDNFCEPPPNTYNMENHFIPTSASVQVIYSEQSSIWINVNDLLYFLKSDDANEVKFIWGSEESEFRHLYLITSSIAGFIRSSYSFSWNFVIVRCTRSSFIIYGIRCRVEQWSRGAFRQNGQHISPTSYYLQSGFDAGRLGSSRKKNMGWRSQFYRVLLCITRGSIRTACLRCFFATTVRDTTADTAWLQLQQYIF